MGGKGAAVCHSAADSILLASAVLLSAASDWTGLHAADLEPSMHLSTVGIVCLVLDRVVDLLLYDCRFFLTVVCISSLTSQSFSPVYYIAH